MIPRVVRLVEGLCVALPLFVSYNSGAAPTNDGAILGVTAGEQANNPIVRTARRAFVEGETFTAAEGETFELLFVDGTSITLAAGSSVIVESYSYDPDTRLGRLEVRIPRGDVRIIGGTLNNSTAIRVLTAHGEADLDNGVLLVSVSPDSTELDLVLGRDLEFAASDGQRATLGSNQGLRRTQDGTLTGPYPLDTSRLSSFTAALNPGLASGVVPTFIDEGENAAQPLVTNADDTAKDSLARTGDVADATSSGGDSGAPVVPSGGTSGSGNTPPPATPPPPTPPPATPPPATPPPAPPPFAMPGRPGCSGCDVDSSGLERNLLGAIVTPAIGSTSEGPHPRSVTQSETSFNTPVPATPDYLFGADGFRDTTDRLYLGNPGSNDGDFLFEQGIGNSTGPTRSFTDGLIAYVFSRVGDFSGDMTDELLIGARPSTSVPSGQFAFRPRDEFFSESRQGRMQFQGDAPAGIVTGAFFRGQPGNFLEQRPDVGGPGALVADGLPAFRALQTGLERWEFGACTPNVSDCLAGGRIRLVPDTAPSYSDYLFPSAVDVTPPTHVLERIQSFCVGRAAECVGTLRGHHFSVLSDRTGKDFSANYTRFIDAYSSEGSGHVLSLPTIKRFVPVLLNAAGQPIQEADVRVDPSLLSAYGINSAGVQRPQDLPGPTAAVLNGISGGPPVIVAVELDQNGQFVRNTNGTPRFGVLTDPNGAPISRSSDQAPVPTVGNLGVAFLYRDLDYFLTVQASATQPGDEREFFFGTGTVRGPAAGSVAIDRFFVTPGLLGFPEDPTVVPNGFSLGNARAFLRTEPNLLSSLPYDAGLYVATHAAGNPQGRLFHADFGLEGEGAGQRSTISMTLGTLRYQTTQADVLARGYGQKAQAQGDTLGSTRGAAGESSRALLSPLFSTAIGGGNPAPGIVDSGRVGYMVLENFDPADSPNGGRERTVGGYADTAQRFGEADYALLRLATAFTPSNQNYSRPAYTGTDARQGWVSGLVEVETAVEGRASLELLDTALGNGTTVPGSLDFLLGLNPANDTVEASISNLRIGARSLDRLELGGNQGESAYIDSSHYGAMGVVSDEAAAAIVSGEAIGQGWRTDPHATDAVMQAGGFSPVEKLDSYSYLEWGFFFGDVCLTSNGCVTDSERASAHAHLVPWVAGSPFRGDLPSSGTVEFQGHAIGNVFDGTSYYTAIGTLRNQWSFAARDSVGTGTMRFDGATYDIQTRIADRQGPLVFEGRLDGNRPSGEVDGALQGSFIGGDVSPNVPAGVIGQFNLAGGNYTAAGTFGAERVGQ